jgi:hypothetical protein
MYPEGNACALIYSMHRLYIQCMTRVCEDIRWVYTTRCVHAKEGLCPFKDTDASVDEGLLLLRSGRTTADFEAAKEATGATKKCAAVLLRGRHAGWCRRKLDREFPHGVIEAEPLCAKRGRERLAGGHGVALGERGAAVAQEVR